VGLLFLLQVEVHRDGFTPDNALALVWQYNIIVDASDNAPTRYHRISKHIICVQVLCSHHNTPRFYQWPT
jgi:hypothetical protein